MLFQNPPIEIVPQLWMLGTTAYPIYLIRGKTEGALVEGGISALEPILKRQLAGLSLPSDFIRQIVLTHAHPDHVMAVETFRRWFPAAKVIGSTTACATLSAEKAIAFFKQVDAALTQSFLDDGLIESKTPDTTAATISVDRSVSDGDTIEIDGQPWTVLATPGHSDCSVSFWEPTRRILIVSDATGYYMPEHGDWWPNYFSDYKAYMASIERLAGLGAEVLCLSHNGAIRGADDVKAYFIGVLAATGRYHRRILDETQAGKSVREIAETLGAEIHARAGRLPLDFFQKNCGLLIKQSVKANVQ